MRIRKVANTVALEEVKQGRAVLIDVRESVEYQENSIETALNIPLSEYNSAQYEKYMADQIYLVCFSGNRSKRICRVIKDFIYDASTF